MAVFDTVILPTDGSALAEEAVPYAIALARLTGAVVVPLRVLEEMRPFYDEGRKEVTWVDPNHLRRDLVRPELMQPLIDRLQAEGLTVRPVVRLGDPRQEIIAETGAHPQPLLVMASHGRGGLSRALLGSVASRVLQLAVCPVLVIRPRGREPQQTEPTEGAMYGPAVALKSILVPLDGSELAERALPMAIELAQAAGATLRLVRVAETFRHELPPEPSPSLLTPNVAELLKRFDELEAETEGYLASVAARIKQQSVGVTVATSARSGDPWQEMVRCVEEERPDLIVMTTHGRGGLARWFYGSVADKLLTTSEAPLLMIRATDA